MELPTEVTKPTNLDPRSLLIYGSPKIGKTTIVAGLPDNLIVDIESGSEFVTAMKKEISNFNEFNKLGVAIKEKGYPYQFATLDTVTELEDWSLRKADKKYRNTPQGRSFKGSSIIELEYGLGYGLLREEFKIWFRYFKKFAPITIFIAHVKDKMIGKEKGEEVAAKDINLTGQLKAMTASDVDAIGYVYLDPEDKTKRKITFLTSDEITCGNRCPHLEGEEFIISEKKEDGSIETHWDKIFQDSLKKQLT